MILALDIATKTGWVLMQDDGTIVDSGTWNFSKKTKDHDFARLEHFRDTLNQIKTAFPQISTVVWERVDFCKFTIAHAVHNQLLAVLMLWVADHSIKYSNYGVQEIKKYATGTGKAKKEDMLQAAIDKWGNTFDGCDDNEIDALWVADLHLNGKRKRK